MSFGRRLALFFVLIVLVPTLALFAVLVIVSGDSREGKADARLAASTETATRVYSEDVGDATAEARRLAGDTGLAAAVLGNDRAALQAFAQDGVGAGGVKAVEILDGGGREVAIAGDESAIAFSDVALTQDGERVGGLRVSTTIAQQFVDEVQTLTGRELVVGRNGEEVAGTVSAPAEPLATGETTDIEQDGKEYRAHLQSLDPDDDETLLVLGPREGGFLTIGRPGALILIGFMFLAMLLTYALARTLTSLHSQVTQQALTDSLTGLWNRRRLYEQLEQETDRALRFGHELSFLILDVDDFKAINDLRGHLQGDLVLKAVGEVVTREIRSIDLAARYGGDELAVILVETDHEGAQSLAERLCAMAREAEVKVRGGGTMGVTISVGVATLPGAAGDLDSLVDAADRALLRAKRAGKDQIRVAPASRFAAT